MSDTSNIAYARKYRPKTINDYLGDRVKALVNTRFQSEKNFPNVILIHGTRGTGKTSLARLLAKEYHCLDRKDGRACGHCEMCEEIEENLINSEFGIEASGVQEIDIAAETGKANMQSVLEEAIIAPMPPMEYKVLILDEFHMASKGNQNLLLKIVEEPPKHLVFILCTTNPENILDTIKSRCQLKIEVKKADTDELVKRLIYVCQQEGIKSSEAALKLIVKKSDRVPREAMMMLESVAKNYGNEVLIENIHKYTGDVAAEVYMEYYSAADTSLEKIMSFNKKLKELDINPGNFIQGLIRFTLDCINIKYGIGIEEISPDYLKKIKQLFKMYNTEEMDTLLQIIEYAARNMGTDETKGELIITTTAMRIGKVGLLAKGLTNQSADAEKENKASMIHYKELVESEKKETEKLIKNEVIDTSTLATVFGKDILEVKQTNIIKQQDKDKMIPLTEIGQSKEDSNSDTDRTFSSEDLLSIFSSNK